MYHYTLNTDVYLAMSNRTETPFFFTLTKEFQFLNNGSEARFTGCIKTRPFDLINDFHRSTCVPWKTDTRLASASFLNITSKVCIVVFERTHAHAHTVFHTHTSCTNYSSFIFLEVSRLKSILANAIYHHHHQISFSPHLRPSSCTSLNVYGLLRCLKDAQLTETQSMDQGSCTTIFSPSTPQVPKFSQPQWFVFQCPLS
jgi:hypothetical protein